MTPKKRWAAYLGAIGVRLQWHLDKPICMKRSSLYPEKKAGGLKAISRSVTEGNHRNSLGNNMKRWKRGRNRNQYGRCLSKKAEVN